MTIVGGHRDGGRELRLLLGTPVLELVQRGRARRIASGLRWAEGPAFLPDQDAWIFSDIPSDRVLSYSATHGLRVFRQPSQFANGHYPSRDGGFLSCEHLSRSVTRTDRSGEMHVVCDQFGGRRLNSPNDVIDAADGAIWFTDPTYGILTDIEGKRAPPEQARNRVYRVDPQTGSTTSEIDDLKMPNGLCFSPDESWLYVADSGADMGPEIGFDESGPRLVKGFPVNAQGRIGDQGKLFCTIAVGVPDGMRCDADGFLWVATGAGIECFSPDGERMGVVSTPEPAANLAFGGADHRQLMIAASSSVFLIDL